jgi:hypothetical protein
MLANASKRLRRRLICSAAGVAVLALGGAAGALGLTPLAQERYVEATSHVSNRIQDVFCDDSQQVSAPDFGPFMANLSVNCAGPGFLATGVAIQDSSITSTSIHASGQVTATGWYGHEGLQIEFSSATSFLSVSFHLDEAAEYEVSALLGRFNQHHNGYAWWRLLDGEGALVDLRDCPAMQGFVEVCEQWDLATGTLAPGDYTFRVYANVPADSFVPQQGMEYDVTFTLIPEPTMALLALQGLIAMALAARTKSAKPSPSRSNAWGVEVARPEPVGLAPGAEEDAAARRLRVGILAIGSLFVLASPAHALEILADDRFVHSYTDGTTLEPDFLAPFFASVPVEWKSSWMY